MIRRENILEAAVRLFAEHGYRGTTTRRIAQEAGVSEVTLFRVFGTKDALMREALAEAPVRMPSAQLLPSTPLDPERELVRWCAEYLRQLRAARRALRKAMGEVAARPSLVPRAAAFPATASRVLREYLERASRNRALPSGFDVTAAATVLAGVLFADAMGRDLMPGEFPEPAAHAHEAYVRLVLDGITHARPPQRGERKAAAGSYDRRSDAAPRGPVKGIARPPGKRGRS